MERAQKIWFATAGIIILFHVNRFVNVFTHPSMFVQDWLLMALLISSLILPYFALKIKQKWQKRFVLAISVLIVFLSGARGLLLAFGMSYEDYDNNIDHSFELIKIEPLQSSDIKVYRTNGGATVAFGVVVRQEMSLIFNIALTKTLLDEYRCEDVQIKSENAKIGLESCYQQVSFEPKRWVYF